MELQSPEQLCVFYRDSARALKAIRAPPPAAPAVQHAAPPTLAIEDQRYDASSFATVIANAVGNNLGNLMGLKPGNAPAYPPTQQPHLLSLTSGPTTPSSAASAWTPSSAPSPPPFEASSPPAGVPASSP
eukprot:1396975-Pyramimonas_sp.AAC.1